MTLKQSQDIAHLFFDKQLLLKVLKQDPTEEWGGKSAEETRCWGMDRGKERRKMEGRCGNH